MKTRILTTALFLMLSVTLTSASNVKNRILRITDSMGFTVTITIQEEKEIEPADFFLNQKIAENEAATNARQPLNLKPFIRPEKELDEIIPGTETK